VVAGDWHGAGYPARPLARMREFITLLRECLSGGKVTFAGDYYQVRNFRLGVELRDRRPKIVLGALGEGGCSAWRASRRGLAELPAGEPRAVLRGTGPARRERDDLRQHSRWRR
jgi:alkanesulfonate monooxygenase SsuD/methylene tetrahydromethanopterin reductase-like flavin-dependent oxidoreductase (luciferase family)